MDLNFERQNMKLVRVLNYMNQVHASTIRRISELDKTYDSLKVNRFICKSWGTNVKLRNDELSEMLREAYLAEVQAIRTIHHQTVIDPKDKAATADRSSLRNAKVDLGLKRKTTMNEAMMGSARASIR